MTMSWFDFGLLEIASIAQVFSARRELTAFHCSPFILTGHSGIQATALAEGYGIDKGPAPCDANGR
jgi:hypothetical protein